MEIKIPTLKSLKEKNQQRLEAIEKNQEESNKFQENLCSLEKMARNITNHFQDHMVDRLFIARHQFGVCFFIARSLSSFY